MAPVGLSVVSDFVLDRALGLRLQAVGEGVEAFVNK